MKKIISVFLFATTLLGVHIANANPQLAGPVVTITNQNISAVSVTLRRTTDPLGVTCLPETLLNPAGSRTIEYGELASRCQADKNFLVDAYGQTHTIAHTALLNATPGQCTITHKLLNIAITCQP